jgi:hypothetical protein
MGERGWRRPRKAPQPKRQLPALAGAVSTPPQHYVLMKVGKPEYMRDFIENGTVYMQRLEVYTKIESKVRGDKNEGLAARFDSANPTAKLSFTVGDETFELPGAVVALHGAVRKHGVYCMYGFPVTGEKGSLFRGRQLIPICHKPAASGVR